MWFKKLRTEERALTIFWRPNRTSTELVYTGEIVPGWNEDFAAFWNEAMDEANLREQEKQAAPRNAYFHLLSWNVAQVPAGPPLTRSGACSKQAKGFAQFLRDLEKDSHWSMLRLQEFTASNGEVVTETAEGHWVFATPPCKGQLRLAIVVAADTLPFVIGGSFRVKGRNCALDVWWEVKKSRVICSHSNPSSVMHLYARDLDDLHSLVCQQVGEKRMSIFVWTLRRAWGQRHQDHKAQTLALPQLFHTASRNK